MKASQLLAPFLESQKASAQQSAPSLQAAVGTGACPGPETVAPPQRELAGGGLGRRVSNQRSDPASSWEFSFSTEYVGSWLAKQTSCVGRGRGKMGKGSTSSR